LRDEEKGEEMSWSGTVRCSWCGEEGHNKRGCSHRREYIDSAADSGAEWAKQEQHQMNHRKAVRCGWCSQKGHNARSCEHKKEVKAKLPAAETRCHKIIELLLGEQVGKGSVIKRIRAESWERNYPKHGVVLGFYANLDFGDRLPNKKFLQDIRWVDRWLYWLTLNVTIKSLNDNGERGWIPLPHLTYSGLSKGSATSVGRGDHAIQNCVLGGMPFQTGAAKVAKGVLPHQVDGFVEFLDGVIEKLEKRKGV
jgi:hypothetical protein